MILIRQMLDYAAEQVGIILVNPFQQIKLQKKMLRKPVKKNDESQVFLLDETPKIIEVALSNYNGNPLTVVLGFLTGLRLGEMAAIKETDIIGNILHVQHME